MKQSNKQRSEQIKRVVPEGYNLQWDTPKRNKLHFNVWVYVFVAAIVIAGII